MQESNLFVRVTRIGFAIICSLLAFIGTLIVVFLLHTATANASAKRYHVVKALEGMHEVKHRRPLQKRLGVNPEHVPWCGALVAYAVKRAGQRPVLHYLSAREWEKFGKAVSIYKIRIGDVVTRYSKYARSGRHVGIAGKRVKGGVVVCSGNTRNRVRCTTWPLKSIRRARR